MRHLLKGVACTVIAIVMSCTVMQGCFFRRGQETVNKNKEQLTVGIFDAGIGSAWLYRAIERFEAKYATYTFPSGKTGVEVHVDPSRKYMSESMMDDQLYDLNGEVVFAEGTPATYISNSGMLADLTDMVNDGLNKDYITGQTDPNGESSTIVSKLNQEQQEFLTNTDNKYYCLPTTEIFYSIIYDMDLFEEENLFFDDNGEFVVDKNTKRSGGPDNAYATLYDNGLPATYEQFFKLCDRISNPVSSGGLNMVPITWGGTAQNYISSFMLAMAADYHGATETKLNYSYDGLMKDYITGFDVQGEPVFGSKDVNITAKNGYELYRQSGRYYALKFFERLLANQNYYVKDESLSGSFTHTDAQSRFVQSKYSKRKKRVAMLIDGTWWQSESTKIFQDLVAEKGESASAASRKFGVMPIPKVSEKQLGDKTTILQLTGQTAFISKRTSKTTMPIAKEFLRFCFTDESIREFTQVTGMVRPYNFDMGTSYNSLTSWGKIMYDLHLEAEKVLQDSTSDISKLYSSDLWFSEKLWYSTINGESLIFPTLALKPPSAINAENYFNGLSTYWSKEKWKSMFSLVCNE